jgi:pimeloyl-ACP methyl ester carboxylesterase
VFVFVPGFNVSFENALRRTAQIAYDVDFEGAAVLFSWPSGSGLMSYFSSTEITRTASNQLMAFLEQITAQTGATKIHLIAHSMGSAVLLDTLEKIKLKRDGRPGSGAAFAEIILHSPDVGKRRFSQVMAEVSDLRIGATLYAASNDRAIGLSSFFWGERADPTVFPGVETIDTTAAGSSFLGLNHDLYVTNPVIFNDMRYMLKQGKHPPDQRSGAFLSTATPDGTIWRYLRNGAATSVAAAAPVAAVSDGAHPMTAIPAVAGNAVEAAELQRARDESEELRQALTQAQEEVERERRARAMAESDAAAARTELARERALAARQLGEKKTATAPVATPTAAAPITTGTTTPPPDAQAEAKRVRDANARAARKRRAAKEAAQNWPFSAW